jgi:hypothetical protein
MSSLVSVGGLKSRFLGRPSNPYIKTLKILGSNFPLLDQNNVVSISSIAN